MGKSIIISDFNNGDTQVFREIFELFYNRLCYFGRQFLPATESPEDVVQEAFIKLWDHRGNFADLTSVKSFLYTTVKNHCLNLCKHEQVIHKHGAAQVNEEEKNHGIEKMLEAEILDGVYQALEKLPERCRTILHLSYFMKMKNKEVAEFLEISVNTVKTQKQRGLNLLRGILKATSIWFIVIVFCLL